LLKAYSPLLSDFLLYNLHLFDLLFAIVSLFIGILLDYDICHFSHLSFCLPVFCDIARIRFLTLQLYAVTVCFVVSLKLLSTCFFKVLNRFKA